MSTVDLPNIREPFLAANGQISRAWWIWLQQLMTRIGGSGGTDIAVIEALVRALVTLTADQGTEIAGHVPLPPMDAEALFDQSQVGAIPADYAALAPVQSVFGRTGAVTAQSGDYTVGQVTNAASVLNTLAQFAATTSAQLAGVLTDETGSGAAVFASSPALAGTPTAPTAGAGTSTTQIATTAFVATSFAPLASPALTGTPTAPTAGGGTNTTQLATTAFVQGEIGSTWNTYTPTVTPFSGTLTTVANQAGRYRQIGKTVHLVVRCSITTNGTGAGGIIFTLPVTAKTVSPAVVWHGAGREDGLTGNMLQASIGSAGTTMGVLTYNNGYPGGNGAIIEVSITYEAA